MTEPPDPFDDWLDRHPIDPLAPPAGTFDRIARRSRGRRLTRAAGAGVAVLVLIVGMSAAIGVLGGSDRGPTGTSTSTAAGSATAPASAGPTSPAGTPSGTSTSASATPSADHGPTQAGPCTAADLHIAVGPGDSSSGHIGLRIGFTNVSTHSCTMYGYPGVSFVTGPTGSQVNQPAQRSSAQGGPMTVSLPPNGVAHADLLLVNTANYPPASCQPTQVAGVRVYVPNDTTAVFASSVQQICAVKGTGLAQIYPVRAGN